VLFGRVSLAQNQAPVIRIGFQNLQGIGAPSRVNGVKSSLILVSMVIMAIYFCILKSHQNRGFFGLFSRLALNLGVRRHRVKLDNSIVH
jgi:hypothetical protein